MLCGSLSKGDRLRHGTRHSPRRSPRSFPGDTRRPQCWPYERPRRFAEQKDGLVSREEREAFVYLQISLHAINEPQSNRKSRAPYSCNAVALERRR